MVQFNSSKGRASVEGKGCGDTSSLVLLLGPCEHLQQSQQLSQGPPGQQHPQPGSMLHTGVPKTATALKSGEREKQQDCVWEERDEKDQKQPKFQKRLPPSPSQ